MDGSAACGGCGRGEPRPGAYAASMLRPSAPPLARSCKIKQRRRRRRYRTPRRAEADATRAEACGVGLRHRLGRTYRSPSKQIIGQLQTMSSIRRSGISICIVSRREDRGGENSGAKTRRESPDDELARGEHKGLQSWRNADGSRPNTRRSTSGVHGGTLVWTPAASTRRSSAPTAW